MHWSQKLKIDKFLLVMIAVVIVASLLPAKGEIKSGFQSLTTAAIALLFFMHGAKLSRQAIMAGIGHWRLHLVIFTSTFILFPLLWLTLKILTPEFLSPPLFSGFLYLCALPATVQSAIAFTSIAGGNVATAICSASASSILGIFLSPVLVGLLIDTDQESQNTLHAIGSIVMQLMMPFIAGHLARPLISGWVVKHRKFINMTDRSSILLVVYVAFSEAVIEGIWHQVDTMALFFIIICSLLLLTIVIVINAGTARLLGFSKADEITIVFCGSKKSLANGVPMASVLFPDSSVGLMVLPLMIFHQLQLMICAILAQRYAHAQVAMILSEQPAERGNS